MYLKYLHLIWSNELLVALVSQYLYWKCHSPRPSLRALCETPAHHTSKAETMNMYPNILHIYLIHVMVEFLLC